MLGMDPEIVRASAAVINQQANYLGTLTASMQGLLNQLSTTTMWHGPDAQGFLQQWHSSLRPSLVAAETALREGAETALRNAAEQEAISNESTGAPGSGSSAGYTSGHKRLSAEDWVFGVADPVFAGAGVLSLAADGYRYGHAAHLLYTNRIRSHASFWSRRNGFQPFKYETQKIASLFATGQKTSRFTFLIPDPNKAKFALTDIQRTKLGSAAKSLAARSKVISTAGKAVGVVGAGITIADSLKDGHVSTQEAVKMGLAVGGLLPGPVGWACNIVSVADTLTGGKVSEKISQGAEWAVSKLAKANPFKWFK